MTFHLIPSSQDAPLYAGSMPVPGDPMIERTLRSYIDWRHEHQMTVELNATWPAELRKFADSFSGYVWGLSSYALTRHAIGICRLLARPSRELSAMRKELLRPARHRDTQTGSHREAFEHYVIVELHANGQANVELALLLQSREWLLLDDDTLFLDSTVLAV